MRILVTGGAGFIGSHTVDALVREGHEVSIVDDLSTGRRANLSMDYKFYNQDLSRGLEKVFQIEEPEIVYHLAFRADAVKMMEDPRLSLKNISMSLELLNLSRGHGVEKFIFISSGAVYGSLKELSSEEDPVKLVNPYAVSKYSVESYVRFYSDQLGLPGTILRYPVVYGPRQVIGHVADYMLRIRRGDKVDMWGDGTKTRDYVYVSDVVKANLLALSLPGTGQTYNIGSGRATQLNEMHSIISDYFDSKDPPRYNPERPGEIQDCVLNSTKFRLTTGWISTISPRQGLIMRLESLVKENV